MARLEQRPMGLSAEEAERRLADVGPNAIAEAVGPSHVRRLLANLVQLLALLLWAGAALALAAGMPELTVAIVVVILVNAVFSYIRPDRPARGLRGDGELPVRLLAFRLAPG